MAQKNETMVLALSLAVTVGLLGVGGWWLFQRVSFQESGPSTDRSDNPIADSQNLPAITAESFSGIANVPSGLIQYGGSTSWAPIRSQVDPAIQTVWPAFQLRYTDPMAGAPGSGAGIQMLINNQLTFAQSSRSIKPEEYEAAQQRGFTLTEIPVALEGIAIAVHPDLAVSGLTLDQLRGIYTGQITNWSQVGGPNQPITAYSRGQEGGTVEFFVENILGGASFGNTVQFIPTTTEALRAVSENVGAIYYASAPEVVGQCTTKPLPIGRSSDQFVPPYQEPLVPPSACPAQRNQLNIAAFQRGEYPITRRLFVVIKQNGQADQQAGEAYANLLLTQQGQKLLEEAQFVPLR